MRKFFLTLALFTAPAMAASEAVMHRDPGCGCCEKWAAQVRKAFGRAVRVVDNANRPALQRRVGLPANLASCHTALIDGMAFEGHVPIKDIKRVRAARPKGVRGLAVAGMPIGSPGMEVRGVAADRYEVIAFGTSKPVVFSKQ